LRHQLDIAPSHEAGEFGPGGRADIEKQLLHRGARIRQSPPAPENPGAP
jgi:hypothetical protein